jgi:hypothetical protein
MGVIAEITFFFFFLWRHYTYMYICTTGVHSLYSVCLLSPLFSFFLHAWGNKSSSHFSARCRSHIQRVPYIRHRILFLHSTILSLDFCLRRSFSVFASIRRCVWMLASLLPSLQNYFFFNAIRYICAFVVEKIRVFHKIQIELFITMTRCL